MSTISWALPRAAGALTSTLDNLCNHSVRARRGLGVQPAKPRISKATGLIKGRPGTRIPGPTSCPIDPCPPTCLKASEMLLSPLFSLFLILRYLQGIPISLASKLSSQTFHKACCWNYMSLGF